MRFIGTKLAGAFIVELEVHEDERGFFARTFCAREFQMHRLADGFVQCSMSMTRNKGTIRGLHYQRSPACEAKLVRCMAGALFDVIVDLRPESATYLQHFGVELTARNRRSIYVPKMFAHGFQALEDETEVFYQISTFYEPEMAAGIRHDDPRLGIQWPLTVTCISEKDKMWPLLKDDGLEIATRLGSCDTAARQLKIK